MQNRLLAADDQRMASVVAALKANHRRGFFRQQVDDFAFTFVAPLGADYNDVFAHGLTLTPLIAR